jgi:aspartate kinase
MKFGGTSVGNAEAIADAVDIIRASRQRFRRVAVVVSAMGGVTNILLESAQAAEESRMQVVHQAATRMRDLHFNAGSKLLAASGYDLQFQAEIEPLLTRFVSLCQAIEVTGEATPRVLDALASLGERMSVRLLAAALKASGLAGVVIEASDLIVTNSQFQMAHPDLEATHQKTNQVLSPVFAAGGIPVVTGFMAANPDGILTTLGRGGSDYSAAILGAVLRASEVWIWTDVDGVMTADPRMVPGAKTVSELTYREVGELAYFGAKVVHPKTIRPLIEAGIPIRVCNTFNPDHLGTRILARPSGISTYGKLKAVTAIAGQKMVTVEGRGMLGVPGVAGRAFTAVAKTGASVTLISQASSEQSICFTIPAVSAELVESSLETEFASEIQRRDIDRIWSTAEAVIVTVVGAGMKDTPGIAGKIFSSLADSGLNIIAIAQGSSDAAMSMVLDAGDAQPAVQAIHRLIVQPESTK